MKSTADLNDTINTLLEVNAAATARIFAHLVSAGVLERKDACDRLRVTAEMLDNPKLPAPVVGKAMSMKLNSFADAIESGGASSPNFSLILGGKNDES